MGYSEYENAKKCSADARRHAHPAANPVDYDLAGALFSINHPFGDCAGCSWGQKIPASLDAIEIWNGRVGPQP